MTGGDRRWALRRALDIDMGIAALRGWRRCARLERGQDIADRTAADFLYGDADLDGVGKGEAGEINTTAFDDEADDVAGDRIEQAGLDQDAVHRRVEKEIIGGVVDMAVGVVV